MIIAVDYDETLVSNGQPNMRLLAQLKREQKSGNIVILWTCREDKSLVEAVNTLRQNGFIPNFVNQNTPDVIARMGRDSRKIYADIYIDDKGVRP